MMFSERIYFFCGLIGGFIGIQGLDGCSKGDLGALHGILGNFREFVRGLGDFMNAQTPPLRLLRPSLMHLKSY